MLNQITLFIKLNIFKIIFLKLFKTKIKKGFYKI